jgi:hypothetical protein
VIVRRLIFWLKKSMMVSPSPPPLNRPLVWRDAASDLDEFGRLLSSGKPHDLKKIAQDMTKSSKVRP